MVARIGQHRARIQFLRWRQVKDAGTLALHRRPEPGEGEQRHLLRLGDAANGHRLRNAGRADDGPHLVRMQQGVGLGHGGIRAGTVILHDHLQRPPGDAAAAIDDFQRQLRALALGQPHRGDAARGREQAADADRVGGGPGLGQRRLLRQPDSQPGRRGAQDAVWRPDELLEVHVSILVVGIRDLGALAWRASVGSGRCALPGRRTTPCRHIGQRGNIEMAQVAALHHCQVLAHQR
ncbi:hypothetical protein D9M70_513000 [compost metagenome]